VEHVAAGLSRVGLGGAGVLARDGAAAAWFVSTYNDGTNPFNRQQHVIAQVTIP